MNSTRSATAKPGLKQRVFEVIRDSGAREESQANRVFNTGMLLLISLNVLGVIMETEQELYRQFGTLFRAFDAASVVVFTIEYLLRLWVCTLVPRYRSPVSGRIKFALTPLAVIDLLAILPFYLPFVGVDLRFVRAVRLFRLFRVLKMTHYSQSLNTLASVIRAKRGELLVTVFSSGVVVIIASSLIYLTEHEAQPEVFSSIPDAMWWAVVTLTTVGYGDVYPKSALGKLIGGVIAILGIGMLALPAGIVASGFAERIQHKRRHARVCPHCSHEIPDEEG